VLDAIFGCYMQLLAKKAETRPVGSVPFAHRVLFIVTVYWRTGHPRYRSGFCLEVYWRTGHPRYRSGFCLELGEIVALAIHRVFDRICYIAGLPKISCAASA